MLLFFLSALALLPSNDGRDPVETAVERVLPRVVEARRHLHANPELGEREHETAAFVAKWLREAGIEVRTGIAGTGVVGLLDSGRPGPLVAYRADMDALPITERTGLSFASQRIDTWDGAEVGVMHACGHDIHVAVALGLASVMADPGVRPSWSGRVLFLFQPAEEGMPDGGVHGARRMVEEGVFDEKPGAVFGLHVNPILSVGQVSLVPRGAMAAVDRFEVEIRGKQAHGAYPHAGIDPVVVASHVVTGFQTIASRNVDTRDAVVVTVGKIEAGNRYNIIPETARLVGTIRTHDTSVQEQVHVRLRRLAEGIASSFGARAEVKIDRITPVTFNDPVLVERIRPAVEGAVGSGNLVAERPHMGGEDFAFFALEVPGVYYFLGVSDFAKGEPAIVHTPFFNPDERALEVGVRTSAAILLHWIAGE